MIEKIMGRIVKDKLSFRHAIFFFALIAGWPCVFGLMGWLPDFKVNIVALLVMSGLYYISRGKQCYMSEGLKMVYLIQIVGMFLWLMMHMDTSYFTRMVFVTAALLTVLMDSYRKKPILIKIFVWWVTLQCVLSAIGFVLHITIGLTPLSTFLEMDGREGYFFGLFTTNTYFGSFIRPAGFFDEPGALACWGIYAMVLNRLIVKDKKLEYTLIVTLMVTMSMAYFIQLALFIFCFYRKHIRQVIVLAILFVIALGWFVTRDEMIYDNVIGRFQYDEQAGAFEGDSRVEQRKNARTVFMQSPLIGVGASTMVNIYGRKHGDMSGNIYTFLATDGVLGQLIMWAAYFYLFLVIGKRRQEVRYGMLVLFVGLLQRPFDYNQLLFPLLTYATINTICIQKIMDKTKNSVTVYERKNRMD